MFTTIGLLEQQAPCMDTYFDSQPDNLDNNEDYWEGRIYSVDLLHWGIAQMLEYMLTH